MNIDDAGLVVWDVDGTLIPADLRWLRRAIARTYGLAEDAVRFPDKKVHGYTDESIVIDSAIASGVGDSEAEGGIGRFESTLRSVMAEGLSELKRDQVPYPGALEAISQLHERGYTQTVLTGNLRSAAEVKLGAFNLDRYMDLRIGGFGSDERDRFQLPAAVSRRYARLYGRNLDPSRVVIIGDAPNDIACARYAGFHVVVVTHRARVDELAPYMPDAIIDSLDPIRLIPTIDAVLSGGTYPSGG
ncbi:HAD family hydrolase [Actinoplanes sp. L3-i22]|uniref:HAD family hydrolase n=1 Tax=Actinoplanes sp. L3-i22 TaxID=2836373 RepID=UPI001C76E405|nr:haloacid dehalogenase-like hydrolase [Actinoplanes sp. L3-i22]BCY11064.1 hydrolase [Actinoplanes sp. L3-i22]